MAATHPSDLSEVELHRSTRDRWTTPLAAATAVAHLLSAVVLVGWFFFLAPQFKHDLDVFGVEIPASATSIIRMSDMVVNYWYLLIPVAPIALFGDFVVTRWIAKQLGLLFALRLGVCISMLFFANVAVFHYVLSETEARIFLASGYR